MDFVSKSGRPKYTEVKNWKNRNEYSPISDFYKKLRETIIEMHKKGGDKKKLSGITAKLSDVNKKNNYPAMIDGYKKWMGRKSFKWFEPTKKEWHFNDFKLNVNPELGLYIGDAPYLIKLYFKAEKLSKKKADMITNIIAKVCFEQTPKYCNFCVLDVRNSHLYKASEVNPEILTLLKGEAAFWQQVYSEIA